MGKTSRLGWIVAAVIGAVWLLSDDDPAMRGSSAPPAAVPAQMVRTPPPAKQVAPDAPAALIDPLSQPSRPTTLYATSRVRVRSGPSANSSIIATLEAGAPVTSLGRSKGWRAVSGGTWDGWIREDLLSESRPATSRPRPPSREERVPLVRAPGRQPAQPRSRGPARAPYTGRCDCPYDLMRNGRRCGNNSAYVKPGGASPVCFL